MGGMVAAIEKGYPQREIAASAYRFQKQLERREKVVVGVNECVMEDPGRRIPILKVDADIQRRKPEALRALKARRDAGAVERALAEVRHAAQTEGNVVPPIIAAARAYCTQQEVCDVLRDVLGTYTDPAEF